MVNPTTIANLPAATTPLGGGEYVPIVQNGVTSRTLVSLLGAVGPAGPQGPPGGASNINTGVINQLAYYSSTTVLSGTNALPNGTTATTQTANDNSTKVATTAYVDGRSSGNYTLLSTQTISSSTASVSVTSGIDNTYSHYIWEISNLTSVTNSVDAFVTVQQGGIFIGGTSYNANQLYMINTTLSGDAEGSAAHFIATANQAGVSSTRASTFKFEFWNPSITNALNVLLTGTWATDSPSIIYTSGAGVVNTSVATTGIKLALSSGNIATCQANLYGIT